MIKSFDYLILLIMLFNLIKLEKLYMKIKVGDKILHADLEDNSSVTELVKKFPLTIKMENLYEREMCYRFGSGTLPAEEAKSNGYEIGDIIYWPPKGSFVILYKQNGEKFEIQPIGHICEDVSFFSDISEVDITFELTEEYNKDECVKSYSSILRYHKFIYFLLLLFV